MKEDEFMSKKISIIIASIILSLCIGSIYSWSIFIQPIYEITNFSIQAIQVVFCLTIFTLGTTTSFGGNYIMSIKPYKSAIIGSILFMFGMIGTGLILNLSNINIFMLYIIYGILLGIGVGIIYLIPIPLLLQEFPNNKALGSSISILSFGLGSAIFVPFVNLFSNIINAFIIIGFIYGILMLAASLLLKPFVYINEIKNNDDHSLTKEQALKTKEFYYIFIMIFINIFIGISLISIAAPLGNELLLNTAILVSFIGIANGLGRPFFANLADKLGYINIYKILFSIQLICITLCIININSFLTVSSLLIIASCYGAGFACLPALTAYIFGEMHAGSIFGAILFAWALAGLLGPFIIIILYNYTNSYLISLVLIASLYFIGLYCSTKIKRLV